MHLAVSALKAAEDIARALLNRPGAPPNGSLADGHAGLALFFANLSHVTSNEEYEGEALRHLELAFAGIQDSLDVSLYRGSTGIAWAAHHLASGLLDVDVSVLDDYDRAMLEIVESLPDSWTYDLIGGVAGVGQYAASRLPSSMARAITEHLIGRLESCLVEQPTGATWPTQATALAGWQQEMAPNGYCNLGLAHGAPGAMVFLSRALRAGVMPERVKPLLTGAVQWVLSQDDGAATGARFASWVGQGSRGTASSPVAWCYGDLGVSVALLQAARACGQPDWEARGLELALHAATHRADAMVNDASLCHGFAGNAHLFHQLQSYTGRAEFQEASDYWYSRTLQFRRAGEGIAGLRTYVHNAGVVSWIDDPGFLMGVAGVGLALLSLSGGGRSGWDAVLGCDFQP